LPPACTVAETNSSARANKGTVCEGRDVDAVARAEDVRLHARVPAVGLMAEVSAGLDQLMHGDGGAAMTVFLSG